MSWDSKSVNGHVVLIEEELAIADSAGANVVTTDSTVIHNDLSNKKFIVVVEVTNVSAGDGAYVVSIIGSLDNSNWVALDASVIADIDPTGLATGIGLADLTAIYAPYYKVRIVTDGTDTLDAAEVKISLAYRPVYDNQS